jgi:hypothetical protein
MPITLIYTQTDKWLISKEDTDWRMWQDKLYWFMTSLPFDNIIECADFLKEDFDLNESHKQCIIDIVNQNDNKTFELYINKDNEVKVIPLQLDILQSKGEVIDWLEYTYFFTKRDDSFVLWAYLGGIAQQVREIRLSALQVKQWQEKGNDYIKQLVTELQQRDSINYYEAITENRKLL